MRISDWGSDVCSSDLAIGRFGATLLTARTAMSLKIPAWIGTRPGGWREGTSVRAEPQSRAAAAHPPIESRSRAAAIADAVAVHQRREAAMESSGSRAVHIARGTLRHEGRDRKSTRLNSSH